MVRQQNYFVLSKLHIERLVEFSQELLLDVFVSYSTLVV